MIENILYPFQENKDIEELIYYLRKAKQGQGNIAFWIGAGVSKLVGYPLWEEFVNQLIQIYQVLNFNNYEYLRKKELIEELKKDREFEKILEIIKSYDKELFERNIQKIFKSVEQNPNKDISIFNIVSKFVRHRVIIITTNLDIELENILRKNLGINEEQISIVPEDGGGSLDKYIYYLHGRIDKPDSWVLTETDYAEVYDNEPRVCSKFLEKFLKQLEVLVIMGYSLSEKEIYRKFLKPDKEKYQKSIGSIRDYKKATSDLKIFWIQLLDTPKKEKEFKEQIFYFSDTLELNIKPIPYRESEKLTSLLEEIYKKAYESNVKEVFNSNG